MNDSIDYMMQFAGVPYIFGGNNPMTGWDCGALLTEWLKVTGEIPYNADLSAQMIFDKYERNSTSGLFTRGAIAFYGSEVRKISHVGLLLNSYQMLEAGGGDHTTTTLEEAKKRGAMTRVRLVHYRKDFIVTLKPSYARIGMSQTN